MSNTIYDNQREGKCSECRWNIRKPNSPLGCIPYRGDQCPRDKPFFNATADQEISRTERDNRLKKLFFPEESPIVILDCRDKESLEYIILLNEERSGVKYEEAKTK